MAQDNIFKEYPGPKTYTAGNGHRMEVEPQQSRFDGTWFYVYSFAGHSDSCPCATWDEGGYDVGEYAGEYE